MDMDSREIVVNNLENYEEAFENLQIYSRDLHDDEYEIIEVIISIPKVSEFQLVIRAKKYF